MSISEFAFRLLDNGNPFWQSRLEAMKYMCLIFVDETHYHAGSKLAQDSYVRNHFAYADQLRNNGYLLDAEALQSVSTAVTVRVTNGKISVSDGPFAETKEQLGGFYLLEARDLNVAIRLAANIPSARIGCVEVRPIVEFTPHSYKE
jgi:hypothetical protein